MVEWPGKIDMRMDFKMTGKIDLRMDLNDMDCVFGSDGEAEHLAIVSLLQSIRASKAAFS